MTEFKTAGIAPLFASYAPSPIASLRGNPLVEALPAIKSNEQWLEQLLTLPAFDETALADESYLRSYGVAGLKDLFVPTDRHLAYARRIDQLIRWGYRKRNPLAPQRAIVLQQAYADAQAAGAAVRLVFDERKPFCSYSLIGVSGMGKSTSTEAALAAFPQHVIHREHNLHQVVWLKVDCPKDGSVKELALSILRAFDRVLGTEHAPATRTNVTTSFLTRKVNFLAQTYCLGLLVLDELQNLSVKKSGGREELLNWFQELVNELGLPVVLLGTFKARSVLQLDMRHARRNTATGSATWRPMADDQEFKFLLDALWGYQWLRSPTELTPELRRVIYEETQGINAFVVDMFLVAQLYALRVGEEAITPKLFKHVARTEFEPVQPVLHALRSKDANRLAKFEDVQGYDIDELIEQQQRLITHGSGVSRASAPVGTSLVARAAASVRSTLGLSEEEARLLVNHVLDGSHKTHLAITRAALQRYFDLVAAQPSGSADEAVAEGFPTTESV